MSKNPAAIIAVIIVGILILWPVVARLARGILLAVREGAVLVGGIKASAVIEKIELGGKALGNEFYPAVKLRVRVENEKGEFYSAQIETTISVTHMSKFQSGSKVDVAYDPANPTKVVLLSPTE